MRGRDKRISASSNIAITIAINTLSRYTNEDREVESFKTILRPLYDLFIDKFKKHPHIDIQYDIEIPHIYRERYDLGSRGAMDSKGKSLDDLIDAIELENLEIKVKKESCYGIRR
jgi:hypothetical protein